MWKLAAIHTFFVPVHCVSPLKTANDPDGRLTLVSPLIDIVFTHF